MSTAILTRGIPGSGKSTWAKAWVEGDPDHRGRVNRDDIRMSMFGRSHGVDERLVTRVQNSMIRALLQDGRDVVVDNTNLNPQHAGHLVSLLQGLGAVVKYQDFDVPVDVAIARDALRENPVGADGIRSVHARFVA